MDTFKPATDWSKCCLCQENISEILKQPNFSRGHGHGYRVLDMNITELQKLNDLPLPLNPLRLNNGSGVEQTLVENGAKYIQVTICCSVIPRFRELKRGRRQAQVTLTLRKVGQKGATSTQS